MKWNVLNLKKSAWTVCDTGGSSILFFLYNLFLVPEENNCGKPELYVTSVWEEFIKWTIHYNSLVGTILYFKILLNFWVELQLEIHK